MSGPSFNPNSLPSYNPSGYSPPPHFNPSNFTVPNINHSLSPTPPLPTSFRDPIPPAYTASLVGRMTPIPPPSVPTPSFQHSFTPPPSSFSPAPVVSRPPIPPAPIVNPPSSFFSTHASHVRTERLTTPNMPPSLPSSWAAPLSQPPSLSPSLQLPPSPSFNPAPSLPSTPNLANPYLIMSRPVGSSTMPQPLDPASLRFPGSNPFMSLPPPTFAAPSLMPPSLPLPTQWISSLPSFQATLPSRRQAPWTPPSIERMPIPSNDALVRLPRIYSLSLQPQVNFTFKADAKTQQAYRRQFEQNLKMFYQLDAPPERPFSQWQNLGVNQFAFHIDRYTTVFVNPAALTDFFQTANSAQRWALQAQLAQLTSRREAFNPNERRISTMQQVNAFVLDALHNPRFQGAMQILGGAAELSAGVVITFGTSLIAAPIGHVVIVHSIDHVTTGFYSVVTGKHKLTATQLALETAGVSPEIASIGDAALSIAGFGMGAKAVSRLVTYPKYRLPPINPNDGYNRVAFEEWKVMLRKEMEKPFVVNAKLKKYADEIYKPHASIGNGSTAAAIREEFVTGEKVFDKLHAQKGKNMITCLERWLQNNPTARLGDRAAAENMIKDLKEALELVE